MSMCYSNNLPYVDAPRKGGMLGLVFGTTKILDTPIEFLGCVKGVSNQEVETTAKTLKVFNAQVKLIHPVVLFESKVHNFLYLNQSDRNDEQHLRIMDNVVPLYLQELMQSAKENDDELLYSFQKLVSLGCSNLGEKLKEEAGLDPLRHLDMVECYDSFGAKMDNFKELRLPRIPHERKTGM